MAGEPEGGRWYLSFDPATKTFAFSLAWIDFAAAARRLPELRRRHPPLRELVARLAAGLAPGGPPLPELERLLGLARAAAEAFRAELASFFRIADGAVVDLLPGADDRSIRTVARIRAVAGFVERRVRPACAGREPLRVLVEFQLGGNAHARAVSDALVALFSGGDVALVAPALKNRITCGPGLHYGAFAALYSSAYSANKAHSLRSFKFLEATFGSGIPRSVPDALRGHIADTVMQALGHVLNGEVCDSF